MSRLFYHVMQDNAGNLLFDVSGTMRLAGTGTNATIYGDEALTVILPNPMTNHPSFGSFKCFLGAGDYDFYMAKSGYSFETLTGVQGHGTMAQQDANAVNITGGVAALTLATSERFHSPDAVGAFQTAFEGNKSAGTNRWNLYIPGTADNYLLGATGIGTFSQAGAKLALGYDNATISGMAFRPVGANDGAAAYFFNPGGGAVGGIFTTVSTTSYATTSDARLKHDITPLTGALDVVQALKPITGRWRADDSPLTGFLAHEVGEVVDGVITGDRDAVDGEGQIVPQMIDYSKLVPWLVGCCQELAEQVQVLTARLDAVGG